ncbi:MAG: glycosyltransferase family 39 protein [Chloroflexi bacterium]|nr:glycosyltransferase family 39 protein [Chloroflexota bacterium]
MKQRISFRAFILSDVGILVLLALAKLIFHLLTNGQYGFHRDELDSLDNARYLDWGFVAYPPLMPFFARIALELFGPSLVGLRFFAALNTSIAMVLTGLIARELGGNRTTQIITALGAAIAPIVLFSSALFHYFGFDHLWWVLIAYFVIRLLKSDDARWWLAIGAVIGLGMMSKYTMAFFVVGIVGAVVLTSARKYLLNKWLWGGVALSILIFLPNIIWQIQHNFISLDFLSSIHARDVRWGRTDDFWIEQIIQSSNPFMLPFWIAGLIFYFFSSAGKPYRMIGWMAIVPFALFVIAQGRGYYTNTLYPMLIAGGAVLIEQWLRALPRLGARLAYGFAWGLIVAGAIVAGALVLPLAPINSDWWKISSEVNGELREQIGWEELTQTVAEIYAQLPADERARTGIFTGNYGEAGAINLYGSKYGLPKAISGMNSYWLRGYGSPPPETLIVLGEDLYGLNRTFDTCKASGYIKNKYGVANEESRDHPIIYVCRGLRKPWDEIWANALDFG